MSLHQVVPAAAATLYEKPLHHLSLEDVTVPDLTAAQFSELNVDQARAYLAAKVLAAHLNGQLTMTLIAAFTRADVAHPKPLFGPVRHTPPAQQLKLIA